MRASLLLLPLCFALSSCQDLILDSEDDQPTNTETNINNISEKIDSDKDGVFDSQDAFPNDATEWLDTDKDSIGNNADSDDDGDGTQDGNDAFPLDKTEWLDTDNNGIGNNSDLDDDGDGTQDSNDAFPLDKTESYDTDDDGLGDNSDPDSNGNGILDINEPNGDSDNDGFINSIDEFPNNPLEWIDSDQNGIGNNEDSDDDGDGIIDSEDAFPLDKTEWLDTDNNGIGNNTDTDDDNDGVIDEEDAFPLDDTEWSDFDSDKIGDNTDDDIDNDGIVNWEDEFVYHSAELDPCASPENLTLTDIESTVDWINAMPKPVKVDCFIKSLPRPILINATRNGISAQPAVGARSPRIFINIYNTDLLLSTVPDQDRDPDLTAEEEEHPLELSFLTSDTRSIKAEIMFPVLEDINYGTSYDHIRLDGGGSACRACHAEETSAGFFDDVEYFESQALKPYPEASVSLSALRTENDTCVAETEPFRCSIFSSILDYGSVFWYNFPVAMDEFR